MIICITTYCLVTQQFEVTSYLGRRILTISYESCLSAMLHWAYRFYRSWYKIIPPVDRSFIHCRWKVSYPCQWMQGIFHLSWRWYLRLLISDRVCIWKIAMCWDQLECTWTLTRQWRGTFCWVSWWESGFYCLICR